MLLAIPCACFPLLLDNIKDLSLYLDLSRGHSPKICPWLLHPQGSFLFYWVSKSSLHTKFKTLSPSYVWTVSYIQDFNLSEVSKHDHFILWMTPWHLTYESLWHSSFCYSSFQKMSLTLTNCDHFENKDSSIHFHRPDTYQGYGSVRLADA